MRGELDWIVMKALEKDRNRRYETANGFAADIDALSERRAGAGLPAIGDVSIPQVCPAEQGGTRHGDVRGFGDSAYFGGAGGEHSDRGNNEPRQTPCKADLQGNIERERRDSYFHRIALSQRELSVNNLGGALQLLDECPEDLRQWEWYYLMRLCRVEPSSCGTRPRSAAWRSAPTVSASRRRAVTGPSMSGTARRIK